MRYTEDMSCATPSACACPTPVTTEVPGSPGAAGTAGTNGTNAVSVVQSPGFTVPNIGSSVTFAVDQNKWLSLNQNVFVTGAGTFSVSGLGGTTSVTLTYLNYTSNTAAGNAIAAGALVSPGGFQAALTLPLSIANGGTGAATKANAQADLGLGQNATFINVTGLTQTVTSTATLVAGATLTVPAAGLYQVQAFAAFDFAGVTIGTSAETITLTVNDTTQSTVIATGIRNVPIITTQTYPSLQWTTPPLTVTFVANDVLQLQVVISQNHAGNPTAGTIKVSAGGIIVTPLALS